MINVADRKLYWIVSSLVPPCHACHCNSILQFIVWISYYCVLRWWKDLGILPTLTWDLFYKVYISLAVVCVNNKQHLFNLNGNDGNNISIFNFQVILTAHIRHGSGRILVQCPVEAIALEHWFKSILRYQPCPNILRTMYEFLLMSSVWDLIYT